MDNRKLRYAKRKAKEIFLSQKNKTRQFMTFPAVFRWECVYMVEEDIEGKHSRNSSAE